MNKKIFTLLILLLLLPVTALAADAPTTLYVGETDIATGGYWKTTTEGKLEPGSESDYNVYYDGNGTLTLNNAKIQGRGYSGNPQPEDYGIYAAPTGNQSVSLTINLMGSNTVSGYCGICVETTTADNASLVIQPAENDPQGSLEAIGNKYNGITISSGSGNASLTINNAPVVAISKSPAPNSYHGVCIKTGIATAPALSLLVNGGSLTAQGESGYGIYFYMRDSTTDPSTSLTVQNNALVKATPSIVTSNNLSKPDTTAGSESGGIVFDGKNGTVYGDVELQDDLEIGTDETLTIPEGTTLTIPQGMTLTNYGTLTSYGTVINQGTLDGNGTITCQHHTGGTATCTEKAKCSLCGAEYGELAPHTLTKKEAQAPTCTEPGNIAYWICSVCNKLFRDEAGTQVITEGETVDPATDHDWKITYTWSEDNTTCTAKRVCKNDASHTETATATVTSEPTKAPTCTEMGETTYTAKFNEDWAKEQTKTVMDIPATGHHYVNGYCTECGHRDPDYRPDPISYYNIYVEDVCDGVEVSTSKQVVREGGSITVYVEKDTANYTFDNFKVYYKRSYYGGWEELKEGTQSGEYPIKNIWTHIYIKAEGAEEKEDPTGIESIEGVKVYTKDGCLYVQTPQREQVIIVSMSGAVVKNEEQTGLKQYYGLQPGIYIVRVGDKAYKLRLH